MMRLIALLVVALGGVAPLASAVDCVMHTAPTVQGMVGCHMEQGAMPTAPLAQTVVACMSQPAVPGRVVSVLLAPSFDIVMPHDGGRVLARAAFTPLAFVALAPPGALDRFAVLGRRRI